MLLIEMVVVVIFFLYLGFPKVNNVIVKRTKRKYNNTMYNYDYIYDKIFYITEVYQDWCCSALMVRVQISSENKLSA